MQNKKVLWWALVIALGGFLFGFDTAVISGGEQAIQQYWSLTPFKHGFTISIALLGTIVGSLLGATPSDSLGRKPALYLIACVYLVAALGSALSTNWYLFLTFRLLGGFAVGASSVTAPIYISELAPAERRGRLVSLFQFNVVFGILVSYFSNYIISAYLGGSWRLMLGIQVVPATFFLIMLRFVPESPRWLILRKNDIAQATGILNKIYPSGSSDVVASILAHVKKINEDKTSTPLFSKQHRFAVILTILFAAFNQLSGINALVYFAPRIFEMAGLGESSSLLSAGGIGLINCLSTLLAMRYIDRIGRKSLMKIGTVGLILTLSLVSYAFYASHFTKWTVPVYLFVYIAFFAFSQGAVIWVFISEIFPTKLRAKGQTLGSTTHWTMATIITFIFPYLSEQIGGGAIFLFFALMMCLQMIFVLKWMPETKGRSLEQLENLMTKHS